MQESRGSSPSSQHAANHLHRSASLSHASSSAEETEIECESCAERTDVLDCDGTTKMICNGSWWSHVRFQDPVVFICGTDVKRGRGLMNKYMLCTLRVVNGDAQWHLHRRYSEFVALDSALRKKYRNMKMPDFPVLSHQLTDYAKTSGSMAQKLQVIAQKNVFALTPADTE